MARGVCLGILLICFVQAEHASGLWAPQGSSSQSPSGVAYVGFSHQDGRLRRLDGSFPQNQFRQAFVSPRSALGAQSAARGGASRGPPAAGPAQTGKGPIPYLQSSLFAKADQRPADPEKAPRKKFQLSSAVVSGGSVSRRTGQQDTGSRSGERSSPLAARQSYSFKPLSRPAGQQKASSTLFKAPGPAQQRGPGSRRGSALATFSSPGRKVLRTERKPWSTSFAKRVVSQRVGSSPPGQTGSRATGQDRRGGSLASGGQRRSESGGDGSRRFAPTKTLSIPERFGGFAIRRLKSPVGPTAADAPKPQRNAVPPKQRPVPFKPPVKQVKLNTGWTLAPPAQAAPRGMQGQPETRWQRVQLQNGRL